MTRFNRTKINLLIKNWPKGTVYTTDYLNYLGNSNQLVEFYRSGKWLDRIGHGAYKRFDDKIEWQGAMFAIQNQMELSIHPAGKTSLELSGFAHYLSNKMENLYLFGTRGEKLPNWYQTFDWNIETHYSANQLFANDAGMKIFKYNDFEILISSPERAIMEMLYNFPKHHTFEECFHVMENLVGLQPEKCKDLLAQCNSIKVKRMFLFLAEYADHSWRDSIDTLKIDLGKGKRMLVDNGVYIEKYKITVPKNFKL